MKNIAYFGLNGNPPTLVHLNIVASLSEDPFFDQIIVSICGPRDDKASAVTLAPVHRAALAVLGFPNLRANVQLDITDLTRHGQMMRTSTYDHLLRLWEQYAEAPIWCVVGSDLLAGGREQSEICRTWYNGCKLWDEFPFVVAMRPGIRATPLDFPPRHRFLLFQQRISSTDVRERIQAGLPIDELVLADVAKYIYQNHLYLGEDDEQ